jgi:PKD repeat protein
MSFNFYKQMKMILLLIVGLFLSSGLYAQLSGTKTIDPAGSGANNYFSVAQAVLDLNAVGVGAGGVTFNVAAGVTFNETADIVLTTTTSDATKPIIFQRSGSGANPIIRAKVGTIGTSTYGNNGDAVIKVVSTDYVTFDGLEFRSQSGASTNTTRTEYGIFLTKTATDACKNITVKNCTFSLDKASAYTIGIYQSNLLTAGTAATVTSEGGRAENNKYIGNTFDNTYNGIYLNGFSHTTAPFNFLDNGNIILNNTVTNFGGLGVACYGINSNNQDSLIVRGNTINGGLGNTTTLYGIYNQGGTNTTLTYNSNTITLNSSGSSTYYGLYIIGTASGTNSVVTVDSNAVINSNFTSTSVLYGIYPAGAPKTMYMRHNRVSNNSTNGTVYAMYVGTTSTVTDAIMHNNTVEGHRRNSGSGSGSFYGYYLTAYKTGQFYNNKVRDIFNKAGHTGGIYGIYDFASSISTNAYDNLSDSLYTNGTGLIYGAYFANGATTNRNIYNNKLTRYYTKGGSTVYGLYLAGGDTTFAHKNLISQYKMDSARSVTLSGIYPISGTNVNIYNNYVQELYAPNAFNASATSAGAISGIWINSIDAKVYNNTVFLNAEATTTNASGFGSDGLVVGTSTTNLDVRNNIIINKSIPVAPGRTVAFRRLSTSTTSINPLMNNNIYFTALSPTASTPLYFDGTNVDSTIALMKSRLAPAESNSITEDVPFVNNLNIPYDLHISPNTQTRVEGGATVEALVTVDYDGNTRSTSAPDIGADEGSFTAVPGDFAGPTIANVTISPNTVQCNALPHVITATITDASGVKTAKIIWTKNGVSQTPINMTRGSANVWTGTIPAQYSTNSSIRVNWNLLAEDSVLIPNAKSFIGTTYQDAALYINAGYTGNDTVNAGSTIQFNAKPTPALATMGSNNSANNIVTPFYRVWGANKRQYLYRASELTSAGLPSGGISSIAFDVTSTGTATVIPSFNIYIDSTQVTTAGTTYLPNNNLVYSNTTGFTATTGVNSFAFSNPFVWNGTSNVYVTICWADGTAGGTTTFYVKSSTTTYNSSTYTNTDNTNTTAQCALTTGTATGARPDIAFGYNPPRTYAWTTSPNATLSSTTILNPTSTLSAAGNYQYIVSVSDGVCTNTDTVNIVAVIPQKPTANFSASTVTPNIGGAPTTVTFTDLSTNTPDKWKWEFTPNNVTYMAGTTDSSQNPQVRFTAKGPFTVKLRASNLGGFDDTIRTNYISTIVSYCPSNATSTADDDIGNISIIDLATNNTLLSNGVDSPATSRADANKVYTNWHDSTNVVVPNLYKGDKYKLQLGRIWQAGNYATNATAYIDYNNNGSFEDAGERIDIGWYPNTARRTLTDFTIPCTADTGFLRMRIVLVELFSNPNAPQPSCGTYTWGETEDYKIRVLPTQLLYDSSAAYHPQLADVQPNTTNNQVVGIKVVAGGCDGNLAATNFSISMAGTTNLADVTNVKLWYTGSSNAFATTTQYDVTKTANATLSFTGNQALLADTNYFWLTYDLATNATLGNSIDAVVNSVTVGGVAQTPAVTSPTGSRLINFPVSLVSNTLIQNISAVEKGINNNPILTGMLVMSSTGAAVPVTQVKVALTGTTRKADIKDVKVWYSGSNKTLNTTTATQFDSTRTILLDTMTFTGSQNITVDTNYFWVTYSIKDTAITGNFADAEVLSYTINGNVAAPANTNPSGRRRIIGQYCPAAATNTADEDIGKFVLGTFVNGVDTPINNNSTSVNLYSNLTNLTGLQVQKAVTTPVSVSIINAGVSVYTTSVNIFIDYNQNGVFDLPQERVYKAIAANNLLSRTVSGNIIVPITALTGPTRMRVIANETSLADLNPCGTFTWGEVEDYTVNILPPPPGDYYPPDFISTAINPAGGACTAVPHTVSVVVTDTVGVDTVYMNWAINNVAQPVVIMTAGANNTYSTVIPAASANAITYSFSAVDVSPNRNRSTYAGGGYADEQLKSKLLSSPDGYIGVGGTYQLSAYISNAVKLGSGTTTGTGPFSPYYTTWWGNKQQYLITATELLAGGYTPGAITSLGLQVGTVTTTLALTNFTISMAHTSLTALTSSFVTGLTPVYTNAAYTVIPNAMNTHAFSNAFIWDGVSNIIIETCFNNSNWNGSQTIQYTTTPFVSCNYSAQYNATVCSNTSGSTGSNRPNFFIGQPISVTHSWINPPNGGLSATNIPNPTATPTAGLGTYSYIVNISDNSCTISDTINVNVIAPPVVNLGPNKILCTGSSITLDAGNPGETYLWSTGATTQTIDATVGATYIVAVTNKAGLVGRDTVVLTQVPAPSASLGADTVYVCTGSATTFDAGNAGATYLWSTGATTQTVNVGNAGLYTVAVTNTNGCTTVDSVRILNIAAPVVNLGADQSICAGSPVTFDAGNPGSTYLWSNGTTGQTMTISQPGTYHVRVTNLDGCISRDTVVLNSKPLPAVSLGPNVAKCPTDSVTLDAGTGYTSYLWNNGATTQSIRVATAGSYIVFVTNADGCVGTDTIVVSNNAVPVVNLGNDRDICTSDTITLDAGNAGSTYLWSNGATTQTIKVNLAGTYSVVVTNSFGCVSSDAVVFTNKPVPISTFSTDTSSGQSVTFLATATAGLQYAWNFGDPTSPANTSQLANPTHVYTAPGTYTVTLTVTNVATGCRATTVETVVVTGLGNDFAEVFKLGAAPNPFAGQTLISYVLPENANSVTVEVYDMIGRKVASILTDEAQNAGNYQFDFKNEDLQTASGVYMVRLTVDAKVAYIRIVDVAKK